MDAQVIINGNDVSDYLISIKRNKNYCSISQTFVVELVLSYPTAIDPSDTVVIYEQGTKVLTGFVSKTTKSAVEYNIIIEGQDVFKKASDFFVVDTVTTEENQTVRYWIDYLLNEAGLDATYTDGNGPFVIADQEIGLDTAENIIIQLLQYAGWYAHVDENGLIIIGKIRKTPIPSSIIQNQDILSMSFDKSYDKTRNVVKVFGGIEFDGEDFDVIFAKARKDMDILPVDQTVVLGNPLISDQNQANLIANEMLAEFSKPEFIKNVEIIGDPNMIAGKFVEVYSDMFIGKALISTMSSEFGASGYIMNLVLDDLCPRLSNAVREVDELYAGTAGDGVWQYNVYSGYWIDISQGMTDLYVNDLSVSDGMLIASTPSGVFTKFLSDPWVYNPLVITPSGLDLIDGSYSFPTVYANSFSNEFNAVVNWSGGVSKYAWFVTGIPDYASGIVNWSYVPLTSSGNALSKQGLDMEGYHDFKYITVQHGFSAEIEDEDLSWFSYFGVADDFAMNAPPRVSMFNQYDEDLDPAWTIEVPNGGTGAVVSNNELLAFIDGEAPLHIHQVSTGEEVVVGGVAGGDYIIFHNNVLLKFSNDNMFVEGSEFELLFSVIQVSAFNTDTNEFELIFSKPAGDYLVNGRRIRWYGVCRVGDRLFAAVHDFESDTATATMEFGIYEFTETGVVGASDLTAFVTGLGSSEDGQARIPSPGNMEIISDKTSNIYFAARLPRPGLFEDPDTTEHYLCAFTVDVGPTLGYSHLTDGIDAFTSEPLLSTASMGYFNIAETSILADVFGNAVLSDLQFTILADNDTIWHQVGTTLYRKTVTGITIDQSEIEGDIKLLTDTEIITEEYDEPFFLVRVYDQVDYTLLRTYTITVPSDDVRILALLTNYILFRVESDVRAYIADEGPTSISVNRSELYSTDNNIDIFLTYSGYGFTEVNFDTYLPASVYGPSGIKFSQDLFEFSNPYTLAQVEVYDMLGRNNNENTELYYTTSAGIYKYTVSGIAQLKNVVQATEIEGRIQGSGEIFFSVQDEVKSSVDDLLTYADISTNLPGTNITVLRLDKA